MKQSFFLGGTSPNGFRTGFFNVLKNPDYYTYILKGGPGTGKSTLMKKAASLCDDDDCELYYCSSDVRSLDAVVLKKQKIIIIDGTAPHACDPELPGVSQEIINLGSFWNRASLTEHKDSIRHFSEENAKYHKRARRYLKASASLCSEIYSVAENALLKDKLSAFSERLSTKIFGYSGKKDEAITTVKQLSAFTSYGYITRDLSEDYTVYTLNDDFFAGSDFFLRKIAQKANQHGYSVSVSECNAFEGSVYEHLLIPELKIAFMTTSFLNGLRYENSASINFGRFYNKTELAEKKAHISFAKKAVTEITDAACEAIDTALSIHDELEKFYINSLDTKRLNKFSEKLLDDILR